MAKTKAKLKRFEVRYWDQAVGQVYRAGFYHAFSKADAVKQAKAEYVLLFKKPTKGLGWVAIPVKSNPGMFGPEAKASAKQVTKVRKVREKGTNALGEIIGAGPHGWLKVKWDNRSKPTLIKRSEITLARGLKSLNPGSSKQTVKYWTKVVRSLFPIKDSERSGIASFLLERMSATEAQAVMRSLKLPWPRSIVIENPKLKGYLKRARTPIVRPKGKLPNPDQQVIYLDRIGGQWEARWFNYDEGRYFRVKDSEPDAAVRKIVKRWGIDHYRTVLTTAADEAMRKRNPRSRGSRDALGVWHAENPAPAYVVEVFTLDHAFKKAMNFEGLKAAIKEARKYKADNFRYAQIIGNKGPKAPKVVWSNDPRKRKNPSVTALAEKFQGEADGSVEQFYAASSAPKNLARAGKLVFLKVNGKTFRVPGAMVAIAPNERLWITGDHAPLFDTKAKHGEGLDVGEVTHICYETAKAHIGDGKTFEYVHEFGEDGGKRPHLIIDHEGMPTLRGGDYKIKAEGIVN